MTQCLVGRYIRFQILYTVGIHDQSRHGQHGTRAKTDQLAEYGPTTF